MGGGITPVPSSFPMEKPYMIIRRSIYTFLQHYQYFTFAAALLALPFSASTLLSQPFTTPSSPLLHTIRARLQAIFAAAGFPQSDLLSVVSLKLAQSILTASYTLPCSLSFLLVAKAYTIKALPPQKPVFPSPSWSFVSLYGSLVYTYLCSDFVIVAANASAFSLLFLGFNFCEGLGFSSSNWILFVSSAGAVAYSVILANVLVVCNLALVISGMERSSSGFAAMLKACVLVKGKTSTALLLALPTNLLLASIEGLFQYRIVRGYHSAGRLSTSMASESLFIAYLYSILVILDIIMSCIFFKSWSTRKWTLICLLKLKSLFEGAADHNFGSIYVITCNAESQAVSRRGIRALTRGGFSPGSLYTGPTTALGAHAGATKLPAPP